jgi:HK97 family phage major capsid protein
MQLLQSFGRKKPGELLDVSPELAHGLLNDGVAQVPATPRRGLADWLRALARKDSGALNAFYGPLERKSAASETGSAGGFLVPQQLLDPVFAPVHRSIVWPRAQIIGVDPQAGIDPDLPEPRYDSTSARTNVTGKVAIKSAEILIPLINAKHVPSAGNPGQFGGFTLAWIEEGQAGPDMSGELDLATLTPRQLMGFITLSNTLLYNTSSAAQKFLERIVGEAIRWYLDRAFLTGTGVGQPLGVKNSAAALSVTRNTGGTFKYADACKMLSKLPPGFDPETTCWVVSPSVMEALGNAATPVLNPWTSPTIVGSGLKPALLNIPVEVAEHLPALGTPFDVMLCDFSYYAIAVRQEIEVMQSTELKFTTNQTVWRFLTRVDAMPWVNGPMTLSDAATQVSPFVYLN